MDIKTRVLALAKTNYAKFGFKKQELEQLSGLIAANLTDEASDDDIKNALTAAEGYAQMMQTVYNRGISETNDKFKDYVKPDPKPTDPPKPDPKPVDPGKPLTMEEVQRMIQEANKTKAEEIQSAVDKAVAPFLEREKAGRLKSLLQGHEKLKDIPDVFRSNYRLEKEEDLDDVVARIEQDWASTKQALVNSGQFVEAPAKADPESETDDFVKMMKGYGERNASSEPAQK